MDRCGSIMPRHQWSRGSLFDVALGAGLGRDVDALYLLRECRPDLLRLRLGIYSFGGLRIRRVSRRARSDASSCRHLAVSLAALSGDVRRWAHQTAWRQLLARSYLSRLSL